MGMPTNPFTPAESATVGSTIVAAGVTTTTTVALRLGGVEQQVMVSALAGNTAVAFIKFGNSAVTATTASDTPILPGEVMIFTVGPNVTHVAVVSAAAATLYFTSGHGS